MKVVFVDFDGVLNSMRSAHAYRGFGFSGSDDPKLDPVAVALLRRIVEETNACMVISSTWRIGSSLSDFHRIFAHYGWDVSELIAGMTPKLALPNEVHAREGRGLECIEWIERWERSTKGKDDPVTDYVCIDDDSDFTAMQKAAGQHIHVDPEYGLSAQHYRDIVERFNVEAVPA